MVRYTNEADLVEFFKAHGAICNKQFSKNVRFRPDIRLEKQKIIIEYDGPRHYVDAGKVLGDIEKDKIMKADGYHVIRIPYFIQMNARLWHWYGLKGFKFDETPFFAYPHGFIETDVYPASFCRLGYKRFIREIKELKAAKVINGKEVVRQILYSLAYKHMTGIPKLALINCGKIKDEIPPGYIHLFQGFMPEKENLLQSFEPDELEKQAFNLTISKLTGLDDADKFWIMSTIQLIYRLLGSNMAVSDCELYLRHEATALADCCLPPEQFEAVFNAVDELTPLT